MTQIAQSNCRGGTERVSPELMSKRLRADIIWAGENVARTLASYLAGQTFDGMNGETQERARRLADSAKELHDKADALVSVLEA